MTSLPRIVFMGSPDFAVPVLKALAEKCNLVGVVTQPDRPAGRGRKLVPPPVKMLALTLGLPLIQPECLRAAEAMEQLRRWSPDLIVVAAFGQILRPEVLDLPRYDCINVHASRLPRWRGAAPINAAILAGDAETGVTIMRMDQGVDTGAILAQRAIPIAPEDTTGTLNVKLAELGAGLLLETLPGYLSGEIKPHPQDDSLATYAPMLKKEDGLLDFTRPAEELARRVRAFNPWPGAFFEWEGGLFKVHRARLSGEKSPGAGSRLIVEGRPAIGTSEGILILEEVQPAGKKSMPGKAFLAGGRNWEET
ncbi:MAG: methionyl-tRNA formyltransferase [Chloroflexi bacterium]|nr:methionyl-tRNA formyltransferase [Chloroflexota bacterium]